MPDIPRRSFLQHIGVAAPLAFASRAVAADGDMDAVLAQVATQHEANIRRYQNWVRQPSIAAENRGMNEGCALMMDMLREAGFTHVEKAPTSGMPGVFATLDAGAPRTVGIYFMYDVKQVDPKEWSSPPFDAAIVDRPGIGRVLMGRGAVNQKGPESAFLGALNAFRAAGRKLPVNLVFVAEGEEEIGSPHFHEIVHRTDVAAAFRKCSGVYMPSASQSLKGDVGISLGAKGVIEVELVSSGESWGRGPSHDVHSSTEAMIDSPSWHLVQALNTLVGPDGHTPAIDNFAAKARPLSPAEKAMIRARSTPDDERLTKQALGVKRWVHDVDFLEAQELLVSRPTVNIEGLVGGYTGPGGKTVLPHRATAKLDLRLVPDMTANEALAALKAHLAKRGFGDIEVNMTGGYDPTSTAPDAPLIRAQQTLLKRMGIDSYLWPRNAGSWPGYVFTGDPLRLPAGHWGLGYGTGAHAPDEFFIIESSNPKVQGYDGAIRSHVQYLYELASI